MRNLKILIAKLTEKIKEQLYLQPPAALVQDIAHAPLSRPSEVAAQRRFCNHLLHTFNYTSERVVYIEADTSSSSPAPDPISPCQQPSTLVAAQLSGPISASTQIREDDQVPYLGTRLQVPRAKKIHRLREAGAEQAIWRAIKKLR